MKVLVIGSGGREHALCWKLARSEAVSGLYAAPGSDAIAAHATCVDLPDADAAARFCTEHDVALAVVGPEAPLVAGWADTLRAAGLAVFGPDQAAARLEGSKVFSKAFMARHGIPTAGHARFDALAPALAHVRANPGPCVVKADGLAAGKGVTVCADAAEAEAALRAMLEDHAFGEAGNQVVVEERLTGEELSYFVVADGRDYVAFPSAQDHKPVADGDTGPNTGGMGAYCPAPLMTPELECRIRAEVVEPTLAGMAADGHPYRGLLYVGLMVDAGEPKVLEYNVRFGDPECQPLLLLLQSDLLPLLHGAATGKLAGTVPTWREGAAATVVLTAPGYPGAYPKGLPISGLDAVAEGPDCQVFHAGTARQAGQWVTQGGRVLNVTCSGPDLRAALDACYDAAARIHWEGVHYRRDIGRKGLARLDR